MQNYRVSELQGTSGKDPHAWAPRGSWLPETSCWRQHLIQMRSDTHVLMPQLPAKASDNFHYTEGWARWPRKNSHFSNPIYLIRLSLQSELGPFLCVKSQICFKVCCFRTAVLWERGEVGDQWNSRSWVTGRTKTRGLGKINIEMHPRSYLVNDICFKVLIDGNCSTSLSSQFRDLGEKNLFIPSCGMLRCLTSENL